MALSLSRLAAELPLFIVNDFCLVDLLIFVFFVRLFVILPLLIT